MGKNIDGVPGIRTLDRRMVSADKSIELGIAVHKNLFLF